MVVFTVKQNVTYKRKHYKAIHTVSENCKFIAAIHYFYTSCVTFKTVSCRTVFLHKPPTVFHHRFIPLFIIVVQAKQRKPKQRILETSGTWSFWKLYNLNTIIVFQLWRKIIVNLDNVNITSVQFLCNIRTQRLYPNGNMPYAVKITTTTSFRHILVYVDLSRTLQLPSNIRFCPRSPECDSRTIFQNVAVLT